MAHNEVDDGYDLNQRVEDDARLEEFLEEEERRITVRFTVTGGSAKGRVVKDCLRRTKIVFPARTWVGEPPKDGEEAVFRVVHETWRQDPRRGVLFVERILPRITRRMWRGGKGVTCACRTYIPIHDERLRPLLHVQCTGCKTYYLVAI